MNQTRSAIVALLAFASAASGQVIHVPSYPFNGDSPNDFFGVSVSGAGDVNGDGFDDFIVGTPGDDNNGADSGSASVFSGRDGAILFVFSGDEADANFGVAVSGAGDVNNDGFADLIVGGLAVHSGDFARVFSGMDGTILYTFDSIGRVVSGAGDVNGDGFDDFILGTPFADNAGNNSGSVSVLSGADGSPLHVFDGDGEHDLFGWSVSGAGDVNNDGFADLIVGARGDDHGSSDAGSARVYSGVDGSILYTFYGDSIQEFFGSSVSGAGDVNNDGFDDLIVGAPFDDPNGFDSGSASVYSGADGSVLFTFAGDSINDKFGTSVNTAGDVNGDGFDDLIVGAPVADQDLQQYGMSRVFSGADGSVLYTFYGNSSADHFGNSVSAVGDVNNDGLADFIVGAFADYNGGENSGSAFVFRSVALPAACPGDTTGDDVVNFADLNEVLSNFGQPCPR